MAAHLRMSPLCERSCNHTHIMKFFLLTLTILSLAIPSIASARAEFPVATEENRLASAQTLLKGQTNQIAVYTKGLVCSSCGIGLRIHLKKLDQVDTKALDKGITLDAENQLVVVATKPDVAPDLLSIKKAIHKAGYEPTHYYQWAGDSAVLKLFPEEK
jgi:hypothetical protein